MNQTYLYLLPFKNDKYFKIGISSSNDDRIKTLNSLYKLDYKKALIVKAKKSSTIKILERELLDTFDERITEERYKDKDGCTEIRCLSVFNDVLETIKLKNEKLEIFTYKYLELFPPKERKKIIPSSKDEKEKKESYSQKQLDYINQLYSIKIDDKIKHKFDKIEPLIISSFGVFAPLARALAYYFIKQTKYTSGRGIFMPNRFITEFNLDSSILQEKAVVHEYYRPKPYWTHNQAEIQFYESLLGHVFLLFYAYTGTFIYNKSSRNITFFDSWIKVSTRKSEMYFHYYISKDMNILLNSESYFEYHDEYKLKVKIIEKDYLPFLDLRGSRTRYLEQKAE